MHYDRVAYKQYSLNAYAVPHTTPPPPTPTPCSYVGTEGAPGWMDGKREEALLYLPQSCQCATSGGVTYLFWTEMTQHVVRRLNVNTGKVERILGVGYPVRAPENVLAVKSPVENPLWVHTMSNLVRQMAEVD